MIVKKQLKKIDRKEAERLLQFNTFQGQRPLNIAKVEEYKQKLTDGRFHTGSVAVVNGGFGTRLLDGQKQLTACIESGASFEALFQEFTLNGETRTHELECASLYAQFAGGQTRTPAQIAWMYGCQMGWAAWQRKLVTNATSALASIVSGEFNRDVSKLTADQRAELLPENEAVCVWLYEMDVANTIHLCRVPVIAAMILTWRKSQKAAGEFWAAVRDGEHLTKADQRYRLREFLLHAAIRQHSGTTITAVVSRTAMHAKCIHAWNAWRSGKPTSLKYHADSAMPRPK